MHLVGVHFHIPLDLLVRVLDRRVHRVLVRHGLRLALLQPRGLLLPVLLPVLRVPALVAVLRLLRDPIRAVLPRLVLEVPLVKVQLRVGRVLRVLHALRAVFQVQVAGLPEVVDLVLAPELLGGAPQVLRRVVCRLIFRVLLLLGVLREVVQGQVGVEGRLLLVRRGLFDLAVHVLARPVAPALADLPDRLLLPLQLRDVEALRVQVQEVRRRGVREEGERLVLAGGVQHGLGVARRGGP